MNFARIRKLLSYYKPYKKELFLDLFCSVVHSLAVTVVPLLVRYLISDVINFEKTKAYQSLMLVSLCVVGIFVVIFLCQRYTQYQGNMLTTKVEADIKLELFKHFQKQDFNFYNEQKVGKLMSYITTDAYNLTTFIKQIPETLLDVSIRFVGTGIILFLTSPMFGIMTFIVVAAILFIALRFTPLMLKETEKAKKIYSGLTSELEESLSGIKTVKAFTNEELQISKFEDDMKLYISTNDRKNRLLSLAYASVEPLLIGLIPIVTIIAVFFMINKDFSLGDLVSFMLYADILIAPIFGILSLVSNLNESAAGLKRVFDILEVEPDIVNVSSACKFENLRGNIKFKNVSFGYNSDEKILNNLNFEISAGEYVALVGPSGVGKTTLCNLIPRFYDVNEGEILIDDIPIKNVEIKNLRQNIGFVQQDIFLFSGSIIDNIRYGKLDATKGEIIEAAKNAFAHDFIMNLENGYDTEIGERGTKLSGGQKQRIAIARAFLKNPKILIFDEATSSLDNESEKLIQKSMEKLAESRTTIVIAHRLSTIKNAKRILVLTKSGITEEGTHEELLSKGGVYASLYRIFSS